MSISLFAQEPNKVVVKYVNDHMGKKVKSGICFDLVDGALKKINKKWSKKSDTRYIFGKKITQDSVIPGDIIEYLGCKFKNGTKAECHVAIAMSTISGGKILVAEQNYQDKKNFKTRRDSKVVMNKEDINSLERGKILFWRPVY